MIQEIENAIAEIQQPRSKFQLEKFVVGQHATEQMRYYQTLIEMQDLIFKYKSTQIKIKIAEAKIEKLRKTGDEVDELKAQERELGLTQTRLAMVGAERELNHLIEIWKSFPIKYTREEIEKAQPEYWKQRLTNNARAMLMGGASVGYSHIEAMEQAGVLDSFVAEVEASRRELA